MIRQTAASALLPLVLSAGCQVYTPIEVAPTSAGQTVRVTLTQAGTVHLAQLLGGGATSLDGRLSAVSDTSLAMNVVGLTRTTGADEMWNGEAVQIPRAEVASVATQRTSVARSAILAAVLVGGAFIAAHSIGSDVSGTNRGNPGTIQ